MARSRRLKAFIPLMDLPQLQVGLSRVTGPATGSQSVIFPDTTLGTPFLTQPGLVNAKSLNRFNIFLPLDPSGHITAPADRRGRNPRQGLWSSSSAAPQAVLAARRLLRGQAGRLRPTRRGRRRFYVAGETLGLVERKLREKQAHDVELSQARVDVGRARVLVADLGKAERNAGRPARRCRASVPAAGAPGARTEFPIEAQSAALRLRPCRAGPAVDLSLVPDFPRCREDAVQLAKRQRLEVRLMIVGLRIARLLGSLSSGQDPGCLAWDSSPWA